MSIESKVFEKSIPDYKKLLGYGFVHEPGRYVYRKEFKDGEFRAEVYIGEHGEVSGEVYDLINDDVYLPLRIENPEGEYVNDVINAYKKVLLDIKVNCCTENYFKLDQANRIAWNIYKKYGDSPLFMWDKFPEYGVFKNPQNGKWYGLIGDINYSKIDKSRTEDTYIINLKVDPEKIKDLVKTKGYYPAWHMNKKSWVTVILDETVSDEEIMSHVEESHEYTVSKRKNNRN